MHILDLPPEILLHIFSKTSPQDTFSLEKTCKTFHSIVYTQTLWTSHWMSPSLPRARDWYWVLIRCVEKNLLYPTECYLIAYKIYLHFFPGIHILLPADKIIAIDLFYQYGFKKTLSRIFTSISQDEQQYRQILLRNEAFFRFATRSEVGYFYKKDSFFNPQSSYFFGKLLCPSDHLEPNLETILQVSKRDSNTLNVFSRDQELFGHLTDTADVK